VTAATPPRPNDVRLFVIPPVHREVLATPAVRGPTADSCGLPSIPFGGRSSASKSGQVSALFWPSCISATDDVGAVNQTEPETIEAFYAPYARQRVRAGGG
jgi:hypothetical protein